MSNGFFDDDSVCGCYTRFQTTCVIALYALHDHRWVDFHIAAAKLEVIASWHRTDSSIVDAYEAYTRVRDSTVNAFSREEFQELRANQDGVDGPVDSFMRKLANMHLPLSRVVM